MGITSLSRRPVSDSSSRCAMYNGVCHTFDNALGVHVNVLACGDLKNDSGVFEGTRGDSSVSTESNCGQKVQLSHVARFPHDFRTSYVGWNVQSIRVDYAETNSTPGGALRDPLGEVPLRQIARSMVSPGSDLANAEVGVSAPSPSGHLDSPHEEVSQRLIARFPHAPPWADHSGFHRNHSGSVVQSTSLDHTELKSPQEEVTLPGFAGTSLDHTELKSPQEGVPLRLIARFPHVLRWTCEGDFYRTERSMVNPRADLYNAEVEVSTSSPSAQPESLDEEVSQRLIARFPHAPPWSEHSDFQRNQSGNVMQNGSSEHVEFSTAYEEVSLTPVVRW